MNFLFTRPVVGAPNMDCARPAFVTAIVMGYEDDVLVIEWQRTLNQQAYERILREEEGRDGGVCEK